MGTIGEAVARLGLPELPGTEPIVVLIGKNGTVHAPLAQVAGHTLDDKRGDLYIAGGAFAAGSVGRSSGRNFENLRAVYCLPFDVDLDDYTGIPKTTLHQMEQPQLEGLVAALVADFDEVTTQLGMPIHRIDYTGYGICAYLTLEPALGADLKMIRDAHKALIEAINRRYGAKLVDTAVSDSGTRITRIPGSFNRKNPDKPRQVRTLTRRELPAVSTDALRFALKRAAEVKAAPEPPEWKELPADRYGEIVDAIRPYWTLGQKHVVSLALSGMLARAGVTEDQAVRMIEELSAGDGKPYDRIRTVRDTYRRRASGLDVRGYYTLREYLPDTVLAYVDKRLSELRQSKTPAITFTPEPTPQKPNKRVTDDPAKLLEITPVPAICYQGWIGRYVELMRPLSEAPDQYHLAAGLALMGATLGRRAGARYVSKSVYGNQYMMLIGRAGDSRKDTAIELMLDLEHHRDGYEFNTAPYQVATDVGSAEGLIKTLSEHANRLLYITEYERLSKQAKRQSTGTIFPLLTTAWNAPPILQNTTKGTPLTAAFPFLSIVAAVQPGILAEQMTQEDIESGFATRWLYVPGEGGTPIAEPPDIDERAAFALYRELMDHMGVYGQPIGEGKTRETRLYLTDDARRQWEGWYMALRAKPVASDDEASMISRLGVHIRKLALLYAAAESAQAIDVRHLEPATAFVEWSWSHTRQMMQLWGVSFWKQIEEKITQTLKQRGPMKRRVLQGVCHGRKWGAPEFAKVLEAMIRNETVEQDPEGRLYLAG